MSLSGVLVFIIILIIIASPAIIKFFFGIEYMGALPFSRILLLESVFTVLYTPLMYLFYARNQSKTVFGLGLTMLTGTICGLLLLVPRYGLTGAAVSIVFSSCCGLIFIIFMSYKTIRNIHG
ncbi:MAG: polysaccharide biosynthesis C-terminal domain-containing protein [Candidatus Omnitrophota bacterium]